MDNSLQALCDAIKKIIQQLKPQQQALSFLLLTGQMHQGKTALLRQCALEHVAVDAALQADIYYNQHGVVVELDESWINQSQRLLHDTLKQLNRCHKALKISGIILCVDINELFVTEPQEFILQNKAHIQLLDRFGRGLGYQTDVAIVFSKLDSLAGFCDFFQNEHATDLLKPLGFSFHGVGLRATLMDTYKERFSYFIESLEQQVIHKMHPVRSSLKRTLIREFPLQLASLRVAIQTLLQDISPSLFRLQALYFTSAKQGSRSLDRLNKKIEHEYALTLQETYPQSVNHRAYFTQGVIQAFQAQTKRVMQPPHGSQKWLLCAGSGVVGLVLLWLTEQYMHASKALDHVSHALLAYDVTEHKNPDSTGALFHLADASSTLNEIATDAISLPTLQHLKSLLHINSQEDLQQFFLPRQLEALEKVLMDAQQSPAMRYLALKIYLMLGTAQRYNEREIVQWFNVYWQQTLQPAELKKHMALLRQVLKPPMHAVTLNQQIVLDARNYLNALPVDYLYYAIAKNYFSKEQVPVKVDGFALASDALPVYVTKKGFHDTLAQLSGIVQRLQDDNWVLARQDLNNLQPLLQEAYCNDYVLWWRSFMQHTSLAPVNDYSDMHKLTNLLYQSHALNKLVDIMHQQVGPELSESDSLFNRAIANQFTALSLMSRSAVRDLDVTFHDLDHFLTTLSVVNDNGKTAFTLTKARFEGDSLINPLSALYAQGRQLPEPVSLWTKQLADDVWLALMNDTKAYINKQWQETVFREYHNVIANRYPFDTTTTQEISLDDFDGFFRNHGLLNRFMDDYLKPFLDMSQSQWKRKAVSGYVLPIATETINQLMRANVITNMFFPEQSARSKITFSLQKLSLDPMVANIRVLSGNEKLNDTQTSESLTEFHWPASDAKLVLSGIDGKHYELEELGPWAFFKLLQKVNVLVDEEDSTSLQILFEINGNSGRYVLRAQNQINPFIPGVLDGFELQDMII